MGTLRKIAFWLIVIGGLNWGLAVFDIDIVEVIFGSWPMLVKIIYALIGLAALYKLFYHWGKKK